MIDFSKKSPEFRRNALSLLTLLVLVLGVGAAWLLSRTIEPQRAGELWYFVMVDDRPVGWAISQTGTGQGGGTSGYDILGTGAKEGIHINFSRWKLDEKLSVGTYIARQEIFTQRGNLTVSETSVVLNGLKLLVKREDQQGMRVVPLQVGSDYIPEGHLDELVRQVARTGNDVAGRMILDDHLALFDVTLSVQDAVAMGKEDQTVVVMAYEAPELDYELHYHVMDGRIVGIDQVQSETGGTILSLKLAEARRVVDRFPMSTMVRELVLKGK